ncbi:MAG: DUF1015 family protein [Planctomycetes bacterium]|jgi:uncharacterized protein (DUF1015 family)|nr:DUF1015 family protein [Planctomycetota bacterium]
MDIRAFHGLHYPRGDVSNVIAPPYDVLTETDKDALLGKDPHNIVRVDLPHMPPKQLGPIEAYRAAAGRLVEWQRTGVLEQDNARALYAYQQTFTWAGTQYTRRCMLAGVRATPLGLDVIPHEHTFAGPKADRLELTRQSQTQISPIFGFHDDPAGAADKLWAAATDKPDIAGELNGVREELWIVTDPDVIKQVAADLADVPVYIADGHHRYTTALNYLDSLNEQGPVSDDHPANFVLFALASRSDPGLVVLPTHRLVTGLAGEFKLHNLRQALPEFQWQQVGAVTPDLGDADAYLKNFGPGAMLFVGSDSEDLWVGRLGNDNAMAAAAGDHGEAWRKLDVAILEKLIFERALNVWTTDEFNVTYTPDGDAARDAARSGECQLAVIMQGTPLEAVVDVADAKESMPHKSTYFYPKIATGMVLKPLA